MPASEISDQVLDWNIGYWQGSGAEVCSYPKDMTRPDRRCKTGIRTWREYCHHQFRQWSTIRELAVQEHAPEARPVCENTT